MKALELINRTRDYLDYLEEHIHNVHRAWEELQIKCKDMRFIYDDYVCGMIDIEVKNHDLSKFSEAEFVQYRKSFYPILSEPKYNLGQAWEHHKLKNPHHWENWTKINTSDPYIWEIHCVHMIIDWMAMSYKLGGSVKEYYEKNKEKIVLPKYAVNFIYEIFKHLEDTNNNATS